jgi:hypothetical protein
MTKKPSQLPLFDQDQLDTIKKYQVVCFMRIGPRGPDGPLSYTEALKEKEHWELLQPENIYRIEEIGD